MVACFSLLSGLIFGLLVAFYMLYMLPFLFNTFSLMYKKNNNNKRRKIWQVRPPCFLWTVWKARNGIAFRNEDLSLQKLKSSFGQFAYLLWMETKLFIVDDPSTLVAFINWLECK